MKRVLIAGGSGLLGSHLLALLGPEVELHLIGRRANSVASNAKFHTLDLGTDVAADDLPRSIDAVIYLAQSDHFRDFPGRADDVFAVNVAAPMRLLDYARRTGARQFIYASSGAVYRPSAQPLGEQAAVGSHGELGYYAATKLAAELLAQSYAGVLDVVLLRFFFVYGARQKAQMLIPRLIDSVRNGTPVRLQGEDGIRINPIVASEAAQAVVAALALSGSHTINVAGPEALSIRQLCDEIGRRAGRDPLYTVTPPASDFVADIQRMRELLTVPRLRFADFLPALLGEGC